MALSDSILPFTEGLSPDNKKTALRAVGSFVLLGDYRSYREQIKGLPDPHYSSFYREVLSLLKSSFECRNVWRTVYYSLQHPDKKTSWVAKKFYANPDSVRLVWQSLLPSDREEVKERSIQNMEFGLLSPSDLSALTKRLDRYCGKIAYLKLRFLSDNDHAYDLVDFRQDLLVKGLQSVRVYEHTLDLKMIENYAKASIQNYAINLIQYHTSASRACVKNVTQGCGTCVFCLTGKPQKCADAAPAYSLTSLNIDFLAPVLESGKDVEQRCSDSLLVSYLKADASAPVARIVDLVFGDAVDPDFESWLFSSMHISVDSLSSNPRRFVKMLCKYLETPLQDVSFHLRSKYDEYIEQAS